MFYYIIAIFFFIFYSDPWIALGTNVLRVGRQMSQVGLTETVKGDPRKFEVWVPGRTEVYTILATSVDDRESWVGKRRVPPARAWTGDGFDRGIKCELSGAWIRIEREGQLFKSFSNCCWT